MKTITDMFLIATLIAYGFKPQQIDRSDPDRQRYEFDPDECRPVYVIGDKKEPLSQLLKPDEIEFHYTGNTLLYPPNYPYTVRNVKYSIVSSKVRQNDYK